MLGGCRNGGSSRPSASRGQQRRGSQSAGPLRLRTTCSFYQQADRGLHPTGQDASGEGSTSVPWPAANKPKAHKSPCKQLMGPGAAGCPPENPLIPFFAIRGTSMSPRAPLHPLLTHDLVPPDGASRGGSAYQPPLPRWQQHVEGPCHRPGPAARKSTPRIFPGEEPTCSAFEKDLYYVSALCARGSENSPLREDWARKNPDLGQMVPGELE